MGIATRYIWNLLKNIPGKKKKQEETKEMRLIKC